MNWSAAWPLVFLAFGVEFNLRSRPAALTPETADVRVWQRGAWTVCQTENFEVYFQREMDGKAEAQTCETLRAQLAERWLGAPVEWTSRCIVMLHPTTASYRNAVGRSAANTDGCSTITVEHGAVTLRRIDLRCDSNNDLRVALPHEMTHIVVADRFADVELPRWADEGMAVLADLPSRQEGHGKNLSKAIRAGVVARLPALLADDEPSHPVARAAYYGQCASLAKLLVERESHAQFLKFVRCCCDTGVDAALSECYGIEGVPELERIWAENVK